MSHFRVTLTVEVEAPTESEAFRVTEGALRRVEFGAVVFEDCKEIDPEPSEAKLVDAAWRNR